MSNQLQIEPAFVQILREEKALDFFQGTLSDEERQQLTIERAHELMNVVHGIYRGLLKREWGRLTSFDILYFACIIFRQSHPFYPLPLDDSRSLEITQSIQNSIADVTKDKHKSQKTRFINTFKRLSVDRIKEDYIKRVKAYVKAYEDLLKNLEENTE